MRKAGAAKVFLSVLLAAALLVFFLLKANLAEVALRIAHVRFWFLLLSIAASVSSILLRAWRWQLILGPAESVAFGPAFEATAIGFAASTVLPFRAGEIVRPAMLSRRTRIPFSASLASVLFERVIDLATVLAYFVFYVAWPGIKPRLSGVAEGHFRLLSISAAVAGACLAAFAAAGIWAAARRPAAERLIDRVASRIPEKFRDRAGKAALSFLNGLAIMGDRRAFLAVAAASGIVWFVIYSQIYFLFRAFDLALPFSATFVVLLVTLVGMAIPTPGAVGGFHKACQIALTFFYGIDVDTATGLAILYHAVSFFPVTLIGFFLFAVGPGRRGKSLARLAEEPPEE
jgi:glycosyltransferase 2 family protein